MLPSIDDDALEDFVLSSVPEFAVSMDEAEADLAAGEVRDAHEALAALELE